MAKQKRGNGEASYTERKKEGRWMGRIMIDYQRYTVYGKTKTECQKKIDELKSKNIQGIPLQKNKTTFSNLLDRWLADRIKDNREITTWENYKMLIDNYIKPTLGEKAIGKLEVSDFKTIKQNLLDNGRKDGKGGLSGRTVQLILQICRNVLEYARDENLINKNPANQVVPPKNQKTEQTPIHPNNIKTLISVMKNDDLYTAILISMLIGPRRGEVLGIKRPDINLEAKTMRIMRSLRPTQTKGVELANTKTRSSQGIIPLPNIVCAALEAHIEHQEKNKTLMGDAYDDQGFIFCRSDGKPYHPATLRNRLIRYLDIAGIPRVRVHDLRHTCATLLYSLGEDPKVIQGILRQDTFNVTMDYTHLLPEQKRAAAEKIDTFFNE